MLENTQPRQTLLSRILLAVFFATAGSLLIVVFSPWRPLLATVAVCGGLAVMAKAGIVTDDGVAWVWPLLPVVALFALRIVRVHRPRTLLASR